VMKRAPATPSTSVAAELAWAAELLKVSGVDEPRLDAELLLAHAIGTDRSRLFSELSADIEVHAHERFQELVDRRARREPLAYITGHKEFMSLDFQVTRDVLIPRPETESIVERSISFLETTPGEPIIIDLGTGSGCIAVAVAHYVSSARVYASDTSAPALKIAARNIELNDVPDRVELRHGDLYTAFAGDSLQGKVSLVVSNPPYVRDDEMAVLAPEIREYEPPEALYAGEGGLDSVRPIVEHAPEYLIGGGAVCIELAANQYDDACEILRATTAFKESEPVTDCAGTVRGIFARRQ